MKLAVMQPYFLPYIGYFQLIAAVDVFVIYDNIKYAKKGWINRNRLLRNGTDAKFSLPLKKDSDCRYVVERALATDFNREKLLNQFKSAYAHAPYFAEIFPLLERIICIDECNLFKFIYSSIIILCEHLSIDTEIRVSSDIAIDHELKGREKVLAFGRVLGADTYVNAIGGVDLYTKDEFMADGIELKFIKSQPLEYTQFGNAFVPWLSIVDVMMFNSPEQMTVILNDHFELL